MDERQAEFLRALIECGLSMETLLAVGSIINTEASMMLMTEKILLAEENGEEVTDGLVLQILVNLMKMATEEKQ